MQTTISATDNHHVVSVTGRIDATSAPDFQEELTGLIDGGATRIVIDLAQLEYISSAGLRAFLVAAKKLKAGAGKLALCNLSANVREIFDISGFSSIFTIAASQDEAVSLISQ